MHLQMVVVYDTVLKEIITTIIFDEERLVTIVFAVVLYLFFKLLLTGGKLVQSSICAVLNYMLVH